MDAPSLFFTDPSVDRYSEIRADGNALRNMQASEQARYLLVRRGRVKAEPGNPTRIAWLRAQDLEALEVDRSTAAFLGTLEGQPRFAIIPTEVPPTADDRFQSVSDDDDFVGLRRAAMTMAPAEAQMAAHAAHLSSWINRNRYCGSCAAPMSVLEGGHKLLCTSPQCGREEFPRTDPVVITLVIRGERCLLARQPRFPPRFYSALAGFVEPGETLEAAVRREVREEAGIDVGQATYVGSQPWPFPTSLMIGYLAEATSEIIKLDNRELEDGRWFARSEIARLISASPDSQGPVLLPPKGVMARRLIDEWIAVNA